MDNLFENPPGLIALLCIVGLVIGVNAALFSALSQGRVHEKQAAKWLKAFSGGAEARKRQDDQLGELHQRVQQLKTPADKKD